MRRLVGVLAVALAIVAVPAMASAGQGAAKTMNAMGTVSAVAPDSLTVKGKWHREKGLRALPCAPHVGET